LTPDIALLPEAAIVGAGPVLSRVLRRLFGIFHVTIVACLPALSFLIDGRLEILVFLIFIIAHFEGVVKVVHALRIVCFGHIRLETLTYLLALAFGWVSVDEVLVLDLVPGRSTFLASTDAIDFFCLFVLNNQIDKLALV
jgi:hypothetical protein